MPSLYPPRYFSATVLWLVWWPNQMSWCVLWYLLCCMLCFHFPHPLKSAEGSKALNKEWQRKMSTENCLLLSDPLSELLSAWDRSSFTPLSGFFITFYQQLTWAFFLNSAHTYMLDLCNPLVLIFCFILYFPSLCSFCFQLCGHRNLS